MQEESCELFVTQNNRMNYTLNMKILFIIIFYCVSNIIFTQNVFVLGINRPEGDPYHSWLTSIYKEVFKHTECELVIKTLPIARASIMANSGSIDGEVARIYDYGETYTNLIRVDVPIIYMKVGVFTNLKDNINYRKWSDLNNSEYEIIYPRGLKIVENNVVNIKTLKSISTVRSADIGLKAITKNRKDLYIDDVTGVLSSLINMDINTQNSIRLVGILERVPLFMYVHKNHKDKIEQFKIAIQTVNDVGIIDDLYDDIFTVQLLE